MKARSGTRLEVNLNTPPIVTQFSGYVCVPDMPLITRARDGDHTHKCGATIDL